MNFTIDLYLGELILFWGTVLVSVLACLFTVLFSKDKSLIKYVIFNLANFVISILVLFFIIRKLSPDYISLRKIQENWIPFKGFYICIYILFADYLFYLNHRLVHRIPLFWTGHFAHHSGDKLHLSMIIRENVVSNIFTVPFTIIGIPLGFNPYALFICVKLILFYQAFLHFYTTKDVPLLKYVFVTPYNHIIHHSTKFEGGGHNYGGIFCIWDRFCGTYRQGSEYLQSFGVPGKIDQNTLWAVNVAPLTELIHNCWQLRSIKPLFFLPNTPFNILNNWRTVLLYSFSVILIFEIVWNYHHLNS